MAENGLSGWMYRVLKEGKIREGEEIELVERKNVGWTIEKVILLIYGKSAQSASLETLKKLASIPELAKEYREIVQKKVERLERKMSEPKL